MSKKYFPLVDTPSQIVGATVRQAANLIRANGRDSLIIDTARAADQIAARYGLRLYLETCDGLMPDIDLIDTWYSAEL